MWEKAIQISYPCSKPARHLRADRSKQQKGHGVKASRVAAWMQVAAEKGPASSFSGSTACKKRSCSLRFANRENQPGPKGLASALFQ